MAAAIDLLYDPGIARLTAPLTTRQRAPLTTPKIAKAVGAAS